MRLHPDDIAFLDQQRWEPGFCVLGEHRRPLTTEVGHIEQASGPGYALMACRDCIGYLLTLDRAPYKGIGRKHTLRLPALT